MKVALTGGIATGKSTALKIFERLGAAVISADDIVHRLLSDDAAVKSKVVELLGPTVLTDQGGLDRRKMAEAVFKDQDKLRKLEEILHPLVYQAIDDWYRTIPDTEIGIAEVPLLFETNAADRFHYSVCVIAEQDTQTSRLLNKGYNLEEAKSRLNAQMPLSLKADRSDFVIPNDTTTDSLGQHVERVWQKLQALNR